MRVIIVHHRGNDVKLTEISEIRGYLSLVNILIYTEKIILLSLKSSRKLPPCLNYMINYI